MGKVKTRGRKCLAQIDLNMGFQSYTFTLLPPPYPLCSSVMLQNLLEQIN